MTKPRGGRSPLAYRGTVEYVDEPADLAIIAEVLWRHIQKIRLGRDAKPCDSSATFEPNESPLVDEH